MTNHHPDLFQDYISLYSFYKENNDVRSMEKSMDILKNIQQDHYNGAEPTSTLRMLFHIAMVMLCRGADALAIQFFDEVIRRAVCTRNTEFSFWFCSKMNLLHIQHKTYPEKSIRTIDTIECELQNMHMDELQRDSALQTLHFQKQRVPHRTE